MEIKDINDALAKLDLTDPIIDYNDESSTDVSDIEGLAMMYKEKRFRDWLIRMYNISVKNAALKSVNEVDMAFGKAQALVYKKILIDGKNAFTRIERLQRVKQDAENKANPQKG